MIKRLRDLSSRQDGFTLVELMVTIAVMSIVTTATMSVLFRAYDSNTVTLSRVQSQNDGRLALQRLSKSVRQMTAEVATPTATRFIFNTYVEGVLRQIEWKTTPGGLLLTRTSNVGTGSPCAGTDVDHDCYITMLEDLQNPLAVFRYTSDSSLAGENGTALQVVEVRLQLGTESATIPLETRIALRNVDVPET